MKLINLINNTYQVWNNDETTMMFQGTRDECMDFMCKAFIEKMKSNPEIMEVFKRLANR